jgi:hypothetical protein
MCDVAFLFSSCLSSQSEWFIPMPRTRTSTQPGFAVGMGTSVSRLGLHGVMPVMLNASHGPAHRLPLSIVSGGNTPHAAVSAGHRFSSRSERLVQALSRPCAVEPSISCTKQQVK